MQLKNFKIQDVPNGEYELEIQDGKERKYTLKINNKKILFHVVDKIREEKYEFNSIKELYNSLK